MKKQIAIIGAGPAGLAAAKACLECGLSPTIFEKSPVIGGVWSGGETGLAWHGMHTNISRWSCMFSDFPWSETTQDFPTQKEVADYLKSYADAFNVTDHIRFQSPVSHVSKSADIWNLEVNGQTEYFDAVIIASGFFANAMQPDIRGANDFKGQILHSSQMKNITADQNVTVYGGSLSGYELAMAFSRVAKSPVTHAFNRASWVLERYVPMPDGKKIPIDLISYIRPSLLDALPQTSREEHQETISFFEEFFGNPANAHPELAVSENPDLPPFSVISDGYLNAVRNKKIIPVQGAIHHLDQRHLFLDRNRKIKTDALIMATGYRAKLPYLDQSLKTKIGYDESDQFMPVLLHETVWPRDIDGLAFVGFYRGPFFGVIELQARWAAGVFADDLPSPTASDLDKGIADAFAIRHAVPRPQFPYSNYVGLADTLAKRVGCYPELKLCDPLYDEVYGGSVIPSHFRLSGRHNNRAVVESVMGAKPY